MDTHESTCFPCKWLNRKKLPAISGAAQDKHLDSLSKKEKARVNDGVPSKKEYVIEATKKTIDILKGAVGLVGVPLVKEVLDIGLAIISTCEAINEVQERVNDLKNRIAEFLLVIAKVAKDPEEKPLVKLSENVTEELQDLKVCLTTITIRLSKIQDQNAFLTGLLPESNKKTIEDCVAAFQDGIDRFQTLRGLHAAQDLTKIQSQLEDIYGLTQAVAQKVDKVEADVHKIQTSVDDLKAMMTRTTDIGLTYALARMPRPPDIFYGRDTVVERIASELTSDNGTSSRICILAPGGMGKTSTALAVMDHPSVKEKFAAHHRFWIPCVGANSPTGLLTTLSKHIGATRQADDPLQAMLTTLEETEDPRIILLDNFETPWHPVEGSQSTVKDILDTLDQLSHVAIIVTMRSEFPPLDHWLCKRLSYVNLEDSRRIYIAIDPSAEAHPELDQLLNTLGHLPYAITLMATRGKRSFFSPKQLLEEWKDQGTAMLSKMEHSIRLSVDSKFIADSPGALELLQILSMLSAGVHYDDLDVWVKSKHSEAVDTLRDAALILTTEIIVDGIKKIHLFVLPVVQSYMHLRDRIPNSVRNGVYTACCKFLVKHRSVIDGPNTVGFKNAVTAIADHETNIQTLLTYIIKTEMALGDTDTLPVYSLRPSLVDEPSEPSASDLHVQSERLDALLVFIWYQRWTRPRTEMAQLILDLFKNRKDAKREASTSFCLGSTSREFHKTRDAIVHFQQAGKLFLYVGDNVGALRSELDCIEASTSLAEKPIDDLIEDLSRKRSHWEQYSPSTETASLLLFSSGHINLVAGYKEKALEELQKAQRMFLSLQYPYDATSCLLLVSRCLGYMYRYEDLSNLQTKPFQRSENWDWEVLPSR